MSAPDCVVRRGRVMRGLLPVGARLVALIGLALMASQANGQTATTCCKGTFPNQYGSSYYTVAQCNAYAASVQRDWFGLYAGGYCYVCNSDQNRNTGLTECAADSSWSTTNYGECDWTTHASGTDPVGDNGAKDYSTIWYTAYPSCSVSAPTGGNLGSCSSSITSGYSSGQTCTMACNTNMIAVNSVPYSCVRGSIYAGSISCVCPPPAAVASLPTGGTIGTCGSNVAAGGSCSIQCTAPYTLSGSSYQCGVSNGIMTGSQTCYPPCQGPPPAVSGGTWTVTGSATYAPRYAYNTGFTLSCASNLTPYNPTATCSSTGNWTTTARCIDLNFAPNTTLGNYDFTVAAPTTIAGFPVQSFSYSYSLIFPTQAVNGGVDSTQGAVLGLKATSSGSSTGTAPFKVITDTKNEIEHVRGTLNVSAVVNVNGQSLTTHQQSVYVATSCACNLAAALQQEDPENWLVYGLPLNMEVLQQLTASNSLLLEFLPNSMCTSQYTLTISAADGTPMPSTVSSVSISQINIDNTQTCSALSLQTSQFAEVSYPMYGRVLNVCLQPAPRTICTTCIAQYGTLQSEGVAVPAGCTQFVPAFFTTVSGVIATQSSTLAPASIPVPNINVNITLIDKETSLPLAIDEDGTILQFTTITDAHGRYTLTLSSTLLTGVSYTIAVVPYKVTVNPIDGTTIPHDLVLQSNTLLSSYIDTVTHAEAQASINFYDLTQVPLTGTVLVPEEALIYGSSAFGGCGWPGIIVTGYSPKDTTFSSPLIVSQPTDINGAWSMAVTLFTSLVLVPSITGKNHTFSPATMSVDITVEAVQMAAFYDTTQANIKLRIDGGLCEYHVGSVAPSLMLSTCGTSAHIRLPAFAETGYVYTVPALEYLLKMYDAQDPLSGLQATDNDGSVLPTDYLDGPLFTYISTQAQIDIDVRVSGAFFTYNWTYFAVPDVTLVNTEACVDTAVGSSYNGNYLYATALSPLAITWLLTESYGFLDTSAAAIDHRRTCSQVSSGLDILDAVTNTGQQLAYSSCTTGADICTQTSVFNPNTSSTTVSYYLNAGQAEINTWVINSDTGEQSAPRYSRAIQYKLAGSAYSYTKINVVLIGDYQVGGTVPLIYPPYDPLYILRDPPGGDSFASYSAGTDVSTATSVSTTSEESGTAKLATTLGATTQITNCDGIGVAVCTVATDATSGTTLTATTTIGGSQSSQTTNTQDTSFSETITTSNDPSTIDGDGDLFLTVSGTILLQESTLISGAVVVDALTHATTCTTTAVPTVTWTQSTSNTMQWVSQWDIKNVIIPQLQNANTDLLAEYLLAATQVTEFQTLASAADLKLYKQNIQGINGWNALITYNQLLKEQAVSWPEFYQHMSAPSGSAGKVASDLLAQADAANDATIDATATPTAQAGGSATDGTSTTLASASISVDSSVGSLMFYGGTATLQFSLSTTITAESDVTYNFNAVTDLSTDTGTDATIFGAHIGLDISSDFSLTFTHGSTDTTITTTTNTVTIQLADADFGDEFQVEIMRDPVFGSPVYRTMSGQTRCPHEANTVARDLVELTLATSAFNHINPTDAISTTLTISNISPTRESFPFVLSGLDETNNNGLVMTINGQVITSMSTLTINTVYGVDTSLTLVITKGASGFTFTDVELQVISTGTANSIGLIGVCTESQVTASISVEYDPPCSKVSFAGPLQASATFLLNQAVVEAQADQDVLGIVFRNPEYALPGRQWLEMYATGFLESITVQYRAVTSGQVLTDLDWEPIKAVGSTSQPNVLEQLLNMQKQTGNTGNDYFTMDWDLSLLSMGVYQVRVLTTCLEPSGALDSSLYSDTTITVQGIYDTEPPQVFGTPIPATGSYLPGQPISVTFNKDIVCNSYYGLARAQAWINPTSIAGAQSLGSTVTMTYTCSGSTMNIALVAPIWDNLQDRLVTVQVDRVYDDAGNELFEPVTWSIQIGTFDSADSATTITGVQLSATQAQLLALSVTSGKLIGLENELSTEIALLVNQAIDLYLQPSVSAQYSTQGLLPGSVLVSNVRGSTLFDFEILPLPIFPGDAAATYSPSTFAHYFSIGINSTLTQNNVTYPLLSYLAYSSSNVLQVSVTTMNAADNTAVSNLRAATRALSRRSRKAAGSKVSKAGETSASSWSTLSTVVTSASPAPQIQLKTVVGLQTSQTTASVKLNWLISGDNSAAIITDLTNAAVNVTYTTTPLVASTTAAALPVVTHVDNTNTALMVVSSSSRTNSTTGASEELVQLIMEQLAVSAGGVNVVFSITVTNLSSSTVLYSFTAPLFIIGPLMPPVVLSYEQTSLAQLQITFVPSAASGLSSTANDDGVDYALQLQSTSGTSAPVLQVPAAYTTQVRSISAVYNGLTVVTMTIDLSSASSFNLVLPASGTVSNYTLSIASSTMYSQATTVAGVQMVATVPAPVVVWRIVQTGLNVFQLWWPTPDSITNAPPSGSSAAVSSYSYSYNATLSTGVAVSGTGNWSSSDVVQKTSAVGTTVPELLGATVTLSDLLLTSEITSLSFMVYAENGYGTTASSSFAAAVVPWAAPVLNVTTVSTRTLSSSQLVSGSDLVNISWVGGESVVPSTDYLLGYLVTYSYTDGLNFYQSETTIVTIDDATVTSVSAALTVAASPLPVRSVTYTFSVYVRFMSTIDPVVIGRLDGSGLHTITSVAAVSTMVVEASTDSVGLISSGTEKYGKAVTGAPETPSALQLHTRVFANLPPQVSVSFAPVSDDVKAYQVTWYDAGASSVYASPPLGMVMVTSNNLGADGQLHAFIEDATLTSGSAPSQVYLFSVTALNTVGSSARIQAIVKVPAFSVHVKDYTPWLIELTVAGWIVVLAILILLSYHVGLLTWLALTCCACCCCLRSRSKSSKKKKEIPEMAQMGPSVTVIPSHHQRQVEHRTHRESDFDDKPVVIIHDNEWYGEEQPVASVYPASPALASPSLSSPATSSGRTASAAENIAAAAQIDIGVVEPGHTHAE